MWPMIGLFAGAIAGKLQAVVGASDAVAFDGPQRKSQMTMRATVFERSHLAVGGKQNHGLIEQRPRDRLIAKFPRKAGDVPSIERKHSGSIRD